jgi:hypothetical protein
MVKKRQPDSNKRTLLETETSAEKLKDMATGYKKPTRRGMDHLCTRTLV